ncbi:MAG TPA: DUF6069 family protein [Acidimicrobiales bacterium]|nr:DUF6069 family protein [Acidimicrobiales bacterium]
MTTITPATTAIPTTDTTSPVSATPLWRSTARAGVAAAVATTAVAAGALAAGVPLEISGEPIPVASFAQLTLMGATLGLLLATALRRWAARPRRTFTAATVALTVLSVVPDLMPDAAVATKATLVATHVVAAALVIPAIARRLAEGTR